MQRLSRTVTATLGGILLTTAFASTAKAGCLDVPSLLAGRQAWGPSAHLTGYAPAAASNDSRSGDDPTIVGLWQFEFISKGNSLTPPFIKDGATLDAGYAQWHVDETEIMNSGRDPATGNFCLGAWKRVGPLSYKLNHFALSWDNTKTLCMPTGGAPSCFVGPTNIREEVTLSHDGNSYTGMVTIDQYDTEQHLMFRLHGTIKAHRITAND